VDIYFTQVDHIQPPQIGQNASPAYKILGRPESSKFPSGIITGRGCKTATKQKLHAANPVSMVLLYLPRVAALAHSAR
jgi:hypothetical protein